MLLPPPHGAGAASGTAADAAPLGPLAAPWQRARVRLRSRLLPAVALDVELLRVGALACARREPSPPLRLALAAPEEGEAGALARIEAAVLRQWCAARFRGARRAAPRPLLHRAATALLPAAPPYANTGRPRARAGSSL